MAAVLHRTTFAYRASANTPDFSLLDWIINPDLSAVVGQPIKYWVVTGDIVSLMDQAARDAVDLAETEARKDSIRDQIDVESLLKAFALVVLDQTNELRSDHGRAAISVEQLKTAIRGKL